MSTRSPRGKSKRTPGTARKPPTPGGRANRPLTVLVAILAVMILLGVVLLVALRGSNSGPTTIGPTPMPTTPVPATTVLATTPISTAAPAVPAIGLANVPAAREPVGEIGMLDPASGAAKAAPGPKVGQPAPDFGWQTAHGHSSLRALRGLEVLLVFFAPWCAPCQDEQPWMASLLQAYGDAGLKIVGVSASPYGIHFMDRRSKAPITKGDLASYRDTYQVSYPLVFDPGLRVANLYGGLAGVPVYYVIDRSGIVRFETTAGVTEHDLSAQVQAAL